MSLPGLGAKSRASKYVARISGSRPATALWARPAPTSAAVREGRCETPRQLAPRPCFAQIPNCKTGRLVALPAQFERLRTVAGAPDEVLRAAHGARFNGIAAPLTANGRVELRFGLREQAVSRTRHRYGQISECVPDARRGGW